MRKAKSIDQLYEEVKNYGIVITNDAPLATALNARIDVAKVGSFAYTPRQMAGLEAARLLKRGTTSDMRLISEIKEETGYGLKYVHGEVENIRRIRRYRLEVENYLYTKQAKNVLYAFSMKPTVEKVMDSYNPLESPYFTDKKVAVIGVELFDDLDKHFIDPSFDFIDIFEKDEYHIDTIYQVGNDRQIAENIVDLINPDMVNETAIVMDTEGPVADAVRSALYRKNLPFKNKLAVKDLSQIRDFIQFIENALSYETVRVRHIREIFSAYGGYVNAKWDQYLLSKRAPFFTNEKAIMLTKTMEGIREMTFGELMNKIVNAHTKPQVKIVLDDLLLTDQKIKESNLNELMYAVNNVADLHHNEQIPEDERKGVLLTNCNNSVYIDRPFVIFAGIGPEWSPKIIGKYYIDRVAEAEKNAIKFEVLMQQGTSRVYAVNITRDGKAARPCEFFENIHNDREEPFAKVCENIKKGPWTKEIPETFPEKGETDIESDSDKDWKFSKTTYNNFRTCPREFMFNDMVRFPDKDTTVFGSVMHEFAELYVCHPDHVKTKGIDYFVNLVKDQYAGISCEQMDEVDASTIKTSMNLLIKSIDSLKLGEIPLDSKNSDRDYKNKLMLTEGLDMCSSKAEGNLASKLHPITGKIDLLTGLMIVDYKTGKAKTAKGVVESISGDSDFLEFQPLIYLAMLHEHTGKFPCTFRMYYLKDTVGKLTENKVDLVLVDEEIKECIMQRKEELAISKTYSKFMANFEDICNKMFQYPQDKWKDNEELKKALLRIASMSEAQTNLDNAAKFINKIDGMIISGMVVIGDTAYVPKKTLDEFLAKLREDHANVSDMILTQFNAEPVIDCRKCNHFSMCTRSGVAESEGDYDE